MMATGPYTRYLPELLASIDTHLLPGYDLTVHIFTDQVDEVEEAHPNVKCHYIKHIPDKKWYPTLNRFHLFVNENMLIGQYDNYIYLDSDSLITDKVGEEILGDRVYVQHCAFVNRRGTYETNQNSTSFVPDTVNSPYIAGSIWSFSHTEFWRFMDVATQMVDADLNNGIMPIWADESVINRYSIDNPATTLLDPGYHYPQATKIIKSYWHKQGIDFPCKVLQLDKSDLYAN